MENPGDLNALLVWLATAGGPYVAGQVLSLLAENWPKWKTLPRAVKFITPLLLSFVIAVGATLLMRQTALVAQISPWWQILIASLTGYLGSQQAYMQIKRSEYGVAYKKKY